jgi:uncharacterized protein (TIRG00374 family)
MRFARSPLFWIGLALSAGALFLAFRGLHWGEVGEAVTGANYGLLALALLVMLVALYVRALRWAVLFFPQRGMSVRNLVGTMNVGYALNNLLPLRVGEVVRAYLVGQAEKVSAAHALSTIIVERILDTITVVAFLTVTLPFIDAPAWARGPAIFVGLGFLGLAVLLATLSAARERAVALVRWAVRFLPERLGLRTEQAADAAIRGFEVLRQPRAVVGAAAWSAVSWLTSAVLMYIVLRAFGLELPFTAGLFIMAATALGMVIPSSPGYIGVFHAIAIESLVNVFGVNREEAASYALVQHAILYLVPIIIAVAYLSRERILWSRLLALPGWQVRTLQKVSGSSAGASSNGQPTRHDP